jgi:hypothetical protein
MTTLGQLTTQFFHGDQITKSQAEFQQRLKKQKTLLKLRDSLDRSQFGTLPAMQKQRAEVERRLDALEQF